MTADSRHVPLDGSDVPAHFLDASGALVQALEVTLGVLSPRDSAADEGCGQHPHNAGNPFLSLIHSRPPPR
ncbi:MAG TPA: hypothetical protein VM686_37030 [Polyangiaceae bacterium]|nr:hypothetical protein [Polyangiaceae bacterium]